MDGEFQMAKLQQGDEKVSSGINLLISILVRYPEIGTINFDAKNNTLKLTFMLSSIPVEKEYEAFRHLLKNSISAYHLLEDTVESTVKIELSSCEQVAMLTIMRDVASLSKGEIALLISILRDYFTDMLVVDQNDALMEDELLIQEEVIVSMLEKVKAQRSNNGLIGIREDGRVFVFNK